MLTIDIQDAKHYLSELVNFVAHGKKIVISKSGKPVAKLIPIRTKKRKIKFGLLKDKIRIAKNFDKSLPNTILKSFEN